MGKTLFKGKIAKGTSLLKLLKKLCSLVKKQTEENLCGYIVLYLIYIHQELNLTI